MDPSVSSLADPKTLPIRKGQQLGAQDASNRPACQQPDGEQQEANPAATPATKAGACPKCGGKLINPDELGWCPKCGYCQSLEADAGTKALLGTSKVTKVSPFGVVEFGQLLSRVPSWLRILLFGCVVLAVVSTVAGYCLPRDSIWRALWSSIQLAGGLISIFAAQCLALSIIAPEDDKLGPRDLIIPGRLWKLTLARLPETRKQTWMGAWGACAGLTAVFLVGGLDYWFQFYKPKKLAEKNLLMAAAALAKGDEGKGLVESVQDMADTQDLTKAKENQKTEKKKTEIQRTETAQCVIIGYQVDEKKQVTGILVAALLADRIRYAGIVREGITDRVSADLKERLAPLQTKDSYIPNLNVDALWVKPAVFCEIEHAGLDDSQRMKHGLFKDLLKGL